MRRVFYKDFLGLASRGWVGLVLLLLIAACAPGDDTPDTNPVPSILTISPTGKVSHLPGFTLTVEGTGFIRESVIVFNGVVKPTEYWSNTRLSCAITPGDIGSVAATLASDSPVDSALNRDVPVLVRSPMPGGGDSNTATFQVRDNHVFSTPVPAISGNRAYTNPDLVVQEAGNICLAYRYYDGLSGIYAIDFLRSDANGSGWGTPVRIVETNGGCDFPALLLDGDGRLNVVFFAVNRLFYSRSTDNGATWLSPVAINPQAQVWMEPAFAIDRNGGLYVIWSQPGNNTSQRVYFSRSTDRGVTWSQPVNLFSGWQENSGVSGLTLAVDTSGGVFALWSARPMGGARYDYTYFNYSHNNGTTWQRLEVNMGEGTTPNLIVESSGRLNLVMAASVEPLRNAVVLKQSGDRGVTWTFKANVINSGFSSLPRFRMDRTGNLNVIYINDYNFYFSRSVNGGSTWSAGIMLGGADGMEMALDSIGNVYIAMVSINPPRISLFSSR